jgi:ribosomal protein S18 acetylase RimI-like enzyme
LTSIQLEAPFRRARPDDAPALAELVNFAGEGLPLYLWAKMAGPGESPWDVGRRRAMRTDGSFSYRNAIVAEADGRVVASLVGYPLPERPEPVDHAALPPMFLPLQELENLAPGTWYVNVLATFPAYRGRGYGARLLRLAERRRSRGRRARAQHHRLGCQRERGAALPALGLPRAGAPPDGEGALEKSGQELAPPGQETVERCAGVVESRSREHPGRSALCPVRTRRSRPSMLEAICL